MSQQQEIGNKLEFRFQIPEEALCIGKSFSYFCFKNIN
jgi:hypothetical protein